MGTVYARGSVLWLSYQDAGGKRSWVSSGLKVGQEPEAQATLEAIERRVAAELRLGVPKQDAGPMTVARFAEQWLKARPAAGVTTAKDEAAQYRDYIGPQLGSLPLVDVRVRHVRDWIRWLRTTTSPKTEKALAPRSVHTIYGVLHRMMRDAEIEELIRENPCKPKKGDLPKKRDADPLWRAGAVYTHEEAERLISDPSIPLDRRTRYALLFLAGMRPGEMSGLRWRAVDLAVKPLGRISVVVTWRSKSKQEAAPKKERLREVPIHPTLAKVLARWKLTGWRSIYGRAPGPDDLLVPARPVKPGARLKHKSSAHVNEDMTEDLERLGIRKRRTYDSRRTFISLARGDGARKDLIDWVTHGPDDEAMVDLYSTLPWTALCDEVAKLRIELREGQLLQLPRAVNAAPECDSGVTDALRNEKAPQPQVVAGPFRVGDAGFEPATPAV